MAYNKRNWLNGNTALSASNFNHMEEGIYNAHELIAALVDVYHPVGSFFETTDSSFNPNTAWGGTWELEAEGLVHVSGGTNYSVDTDNEKDGGNESVSLIGANIPRHAHTYQKSSGTTGTAHLSVVQIREGAESNAVVTQDHNHSITLAQEYTSYYGYNPVTPVNIMQPYKTVYRWYRTA